MSETPNEAYKEEIKMLLENIEDNHRLCVIYTMVKIFNDKKINNKKQ